MAKEIKYGNEARGALIRGANKAADAAKITLGAKGENVIYEFVPLNMPVVTNDGVSILQQIQLTDHYENMGAQLVIQAAQKTNEIAGDGTTTCAILTQAILKEGQEAIKNGANPIALKRGIELGVKRVVDYLKDIAVPIKGKEDIERVATIASGNSEIGRTISDIFEEVGDNGVIAIEESGMPGVTKEIVEGMKLDAGWVSPYLITDIRTQKAEVENPYILLTDRHIKRHEELIPVLEQLPKGEARIVIVAMGIDNLAVGFLAQNKLEGRLQVIAMKSPGFAADRREYLEDIASMTGATIISRDLGHTLEQTTIDMLGKADKAIAYKDYSVIIGGQGDKELVNERIRVIKDQIKGADKSGKVSLVDRLANLTNGVGIIRIGAHTDVERKEKKDHTEDAVEATKAAVEMGIVPGGGIALYKTMCNAKHSKKADDDRDEIMGIEVLLLTISSPIIQIFENCGANPDDSKLDMGLGYNAKTGEYVDMIEAGIIDPVKVTITALENAASVAGTLLTTGCAIVEKVENES